MQQPSSLRIRASRTLSGIHATPSTSLISSFLLISRNDTPSIHRSILISALSRGVQYVHWVMHKCIMVKVGGKKYTRKVCKKQVNFRKTGGKIVKVGGIIIFAKS